MSNIKALYGKYLVTLKYPETLQELIWRVSYMRRNRESWRLLNDSFKPSTTNYQTDIDIKNATTAQIDKLESFYESAASIDPYNPSLSGEKFLLKLKRAVQPVASSTGLDTNLANAVQAQYARMQAANPISAPTTSADASAAAENIPQDIERIKEGVTAIFNSYGTPYTETKGELCTRWVFNSRNTTFKAISLMTQEYPWLMQVIKMFDFFTTNVVSMITGMAPSGQLYGHLESADDSNVDSPRHLLTPLWSGTANVSTAALGSLSKEGVFQLQYTDLSGQPSATQNLLKIYCNDAYEQNAYFTNKPV